jgi:exopolysaccharide production protein ExoZ
LLILNRKSFGLATGVWLALVVTNLVFPLRAPFDFLCQPRVMEFLGGMCIAWTVRKEFRFTKPWSFALICVGVGICFTAGCTQIARGIGGKAYPLWFGLAAVLIISSLVSLELQCATSTGRTWLLLGDASYSIYLIHYPVLILVFKAFSKYAPTNGSWLLAVATAVFSGIVFHLLIEKRVCASARSLVKRERGIQAPPRLAEASHHALA